MDGGAPDTIRDRIDARLRAVLPPGDASVLHRCMAYSVLAPGKRVRPLLTVLAAALLGGDPAAALDAACAIELVHGASLILDDRPCMDDAALRRGRPATHLAFGEDVAILGAVALLSRATELLANAPRVSPAIRCDLVLLLADAVGAAGLAGGQVRDLHDGADRSLPDIHATNHLKTGALFVAAVDLAGCIAQASPLATEALRGFARAAGAAFQLRDDCQDGGRDTAVAALGEAGATRAIAALLDEATTRLAFFGGEAAPLRLLLRTVFAGGAP